MAVNKKHKVKHLLLIEPDSSIAEIIVAELHGKVSVAVVQTAEQAIESVDAKTPDVVVSELALADHSATGFLYEFRSYREWQNIPVVIYTNQKLPDAVIRSRDWKLLNIHSCLYKSQTSLSNVIKTVEGVLSSP